MLKGVNKIATNNVSINILPDCIKDLRTLELKTKHLFSNTIPKYIISMSECSHNDIYIGQAY